MSYQAKRLQEAITKIVNRDKFQKGLAFRKRIYNELGAQNLKMPTQTSERVFDKEQIPAVMEPTDLYETIVPRVKRTKSMAYGNAKVGLLKNVKSAMPKQRLTRKQKLESGMWYEGFTKTGKPRLKKKSKRDIERSKKLKCGVYTESANGRLKQKTKKELINLVNDYCGQIEMLTDLM